MKLEFSGQILERYSYIKCHEKSSSVSRFVQCRRTDRHDEGNSRLSQLCESA